MTTITVSIATNIPAQFFGAEQSVPVVTIQTSDESSLFVLGMTDGDDDAQIESNVRQLLDDGDAPFGHLPLGLIGMMSGRAVLDPEDFASAELRTLFTTEVGDDE